VEYHERGFRKLAQGWKDVIARLQAANVPGEFVTFLTYEMHSCRDGDYTVCYRDGAGEVLATPSARRLCAALARLERRGVACMAYPHHIGYKRGSRGINWESFNGACSPVVEIFSMHACAESEAAPYPYLHSMGPRDVDSMVGAGLAHGHLFGLVGSTDHHSAHPGSHGHGRLSVHATELTRAGIWEAIMARRTTAQTGDRIAIDFTLNDAFMGAAIETPSTRRRIGVKVRAGGALERVELLKNERVLERRWLADEAPAVSSRGRVRARLSLEVGWGSRRSSHDWDVRCGIADGALLALEPRFKGPDILAPDEGDSGSYCHSSWERSGARAVSFKTRTHGNPSWTTNANQGFGLEVLAQLETKVLLQVNGRRLRVPLGELLAKPLVGYTSGYGSPAYRIVAAAPRQYECAFEIEDRARGRPFAAGRDVYRLRVAQRNNQWAWSSPIWIAR
jgi:hypothetical protein